MKSRLIKKLIAYGFFPFVVIFLVASPLLGLNVVEAQSNNGCNNLTNFHLGQCIGTGFAYLLEGLNTLFGFLLFLTGKLLDFAIEFSINPVGDLYRSDTVSTAWNLLRDIINMSFIFILLYIAIGTVLNINGVDWKKQVSQIIIAAILVNFSLFITRVVIDAGNILANSFYTEMVSCETTPCPDGDGNPRDRVGISERFMNALGIPIIHDLKPGDFNMNQLSGWTGVGNAFVKMVVILIAIWVFLSAAILFIARTFALVFILILSPIGIAGANLPLLSSQAKRWREELFKQSLLGVVFLFFVFVILTFAYTEREAVVGAPIDLGSTGQQYVASALGNSSSGVPAQSLIIMYLLVTAALIMALRLTKNLSGQMGSFMDGAVKSAVGLGLGVATGGAALVGRQTVGRAAAATLASKTGEKLKTSAEAGNRSALFRYNALNTMAKGSMDVRKSKLGGLAADRATKLGGVAGLNAKAGIKAGEGGRLKQIEKTAEKKESRFADLSPEGKRVWAEKHEERAENKLLGLKKGVNEETAKRLRKSADKQEIGKEEREKKVEKTASKIRESVNDPSKVENFLGDLRPNEWANLPPDILTNPEVIALMGSAEIQALKGKIDRKTRDEIYTSPRLSKAAYQWASNPDNGFI